MHLSKPAYRIFPYRNVAWGWLYHGLFLILERVWLGKKLEKLPGILGWGYTVTAVFFGWILFRAENISLFFTYVRNMFVAHGGTILLSAYLDSKMIFLIVMGVLFAGVLQKIYEKVRVHSAGKIPANGMVTVPRMIACLVIFWLSVAALVNNSYNPFIYFRFYLQEVWFCQEWCGLDFPADLIRKTMKTENWLNFRR